MKKHWVEDIFEECGAILEGHFELTSGNHSNRYFEKMKVYMDGKKVEKICKKIANEMAKAFPSWSGKRIEIVAGPSTGGIILAYEVAKQLSKIYKIKVPSVFTEKNADGNQVFKRLNYQNEVAGRLVLIVDDVSTTSGTLNKLIRTIQQAGGHIVAVAVVCNRGEVRSSDILDYPLFSLWEQKAEDRSPEDCHLCKEGVPITKIK